MLEYLILHICQLINYYKIVDGHKTKFTDVLHSGIKISD